MRRISVAVFVLLFTLATSYAADFWVKKPYSKWSADECERMLEDSPWAQTKNLVTPSAVPPVVVRQQIVGIPNPDVGGETAPEISYSTQFRSAAPIREAVVRSAQLRAHYDKMTPQQKSEFDANAAKFLSATFPDTVVVVVTFRSNVTAYDSDLRNYWKSQSAATLHETVFLNAGKERLQLLKYACENNEMEFVFPRPKTQLASDDLLSIEFVHPTLKTGVDTTALPQNAQILARLGRQRILLEFKPGHMMSDGHLEF